jgi:hypothetical protein
MYLEIENLRVRGILNARGLFESYLKILAQKPKINAAVVCADIVRGIYPGAKELFSSCGILKPYELYQLFSSSIHNHWDGRNVRVLKEDWLLDSHICAIKKMAKTFHLSVEIVLPDSNQEEEKEKEEE